jgi:stage IV sporulation protein FB
MLRWRMFGISVCIQPSFWIINGLFGWFVSDPLAGQYHVNLLTFILIWVLCTLVTVAVHEFGHAIMGRIFGQPGAITIAGLGGQAAGGYDKISSWKRLLVIAAGPGAGFLFVASLMILDSTPWDRLMDAMDWDGLKLKWAVVDRMGLMPLRLAFNYFTLTLFLLAMIGLFLNILNLFPIIPMDGGMIFKEICSMIAGRSGERFAFGVSLLLAGSLTLYFLLAVLVERGFMRAPFPMWYGALPELSLVIFGMMAFNCYKSYRQLGVMTRHDLYRQHDDDDDDPSAPRDLPPNVREVPVKDPRDFAPRAPGSERPRS